MKKILVIGYGVSGKAAAVFLRQKGFSVVVVDKNPMPDVLPDSADLPLEEIGQVILSPGVPQTHPLVQKALQQNIEVIGEMELGLRHLNQRCFGITGANGKTTTVLLTAHILNAAGKKAYALGNVGSSVTGYLLSSHPDDILIIELSSFQLETLQTPCLEVAFVLNITPNHLDRYPSMEGYVMAKARIRHALKPGGKLYISRQVKKDWASFFRGALLFEKTLAQIKGLDYTQLGMPSKQSIQAAYLICKRCGVDDTDFFQGLKTFKKPAHRIEYVAEIGKVAYYNDSKSSNVHSVIHAVERLKKPLVLIVGGVHKGSSYLPWKENLQSKVKAIVAYGQAAPLMEKELVSAFAFHKTERFADAVRLAKALAKEGEAVLLSPGCSSYDQFNNYEHRGNEFKRLVTEELSV